MYIVGKMIQKIFHTVFLFVAILMIITIDSSQGRPSSEQSDAKIEQLIDPNEYNGDLSPETIRKVQQCDLDTAAMELCMRCAKVTKSEIVYPLCCANEDNVQDWCNEYVFFANEGADT